MKALLGLAGALCAMAASAGEPLRDGDIIFHTSRSSQSLAIQRATHSPYSHVGVIFHRDGRPFVFEAIATVRHTPLQEWIGRGDRKAFVIRRLKAPLTAVQQRRLRDAATRYLGKPYDLYFEWSDERIYCSELVWKLYRDALGVEIGQRQKLGQFDLQHPVVRAKLRERYGGTVPEDEPVISPGAQFDSPLLRTVSP